MVSKGLRYVVIFPNKAGSWFSTVFSYEGPHSCNVSILTFLLSTPFSQRPKNFNASVFWWHICCPLTSSLAYGTGLQCHGTHAYLLMLTHTHIYICIYILIYLLRHEWVYLSNYPYGWLLLRVLAIDIRCYVIFSIKHIWQIFLFIIQYLFQ